MKKLLLLGGSAQQVIAIEKAKELGYYTVLCDFLPDNPGQYAADKFYLVSTTDKEAVLEVARKECISGIVAYASDPAAPTAAYVAEQMNLPGNPYRAVEILCNKDKFRQFLQENGFHTPQAGGYGTAEEALADTQRFRLPVIVKPVDSSGSKGATVLRNWEDLPGALEFAFSFSRCKRVIMEEFIEKKHPYLVGGDIFVVDGQVRLWGLMNCHRDDRVNALVPVGKSYPLQLDHEDTARIQQTLQQLVTKVGIRSGPMNVELIIDRQNRVWPIDIGPRNGGNMIPDLLQYIFGVDIVELTVLSAMGQGIQLECPEGKSCYATHNLHADRNGIFAGVEFSEELEQHIVRKAIYKKAGDPVEYFDNAAKALGIVFFHFPDAACMDAFLGDIYSHIRILLN